MPDAVLRAEAINKSFGAVVALHDVSLALPAGEITGLVGDNGAGKSTLVKIISGVLRPDAGAIEFDGARVRLRLAGRGARERDRDRLSGPCTRRESDGLGKCLSWARIDLSACIHARARQALPWPRTPEEMLKQFAMNVPPIDGAVETLSGGQRQIVAIARAGAWGSRLIVMDEPTAALGVAETRAVEEVILGLRRRGLSVLVISHNLDQIFRITDRIWVLRAGRMIGEREPAKTRPDEIVSMITGAAAPDGAG